MVRMMIESVFVGVQEAYCTACKFETTKPYWAQCFDVDEQCLASAMLKRNV